MNNEIRTAVERIHGCPTLVALVVSGAGSDALSWLLGVPGATRTVLEAVVPYGWQAMVNYLGWRPDQYASVSTAISLSAAAYSRACHLRESDQRVVGISCTASIATDYEKRGTHRAFVGVWDGRQSLTYSLELERDLRARHGEEEIVSRLILRALAEACGVKVDIALDLADGEQVRTSHKAIDQPLASLYDQQATTLTYFGAGALVPDQPLCGAILPGSFNPLHEGHRRLARAAEKRLGIPVAFEISTHNVDKPSLSPRQVEATLTQFEDGRRRVLITREPLYREKAALFPGSTFVIGYDTANRLLDPTYYDHDAANMRAALQSIRDTECTFLVGGRLENGTFFTLDDIAIPRGFEDLFEGIPEMEFRLDLSSTELRARSG